MTHAAPSEEFSLLCDVVGCHSALSMVSGVPRSEHGWGRMSLYDDRATPVGGLSFSQAQDYDLCPHHLSELLKVLGRADAH